MYYLIMLCVGYFVSYVFFGTAMKYFLAVAKIPGMELLSFSLIPAFLVTILVLWWGWQRRIKMDSQAYRWLIISGICTGFVIPTTPLLYTFGFSVMVAMIIMRASLVVISRGVDAVLIYQGYSDKRVRWQENVAVLAAIAGVLEIILQPADKQSTAFDFLHSTPFLVTMVLYIVPYGVRIYILNRYKVKTDQKGMFGVEQLWAAISILAAMALGLMAEKWFGWMPKQLVEFNHGMLNWQAQPILWFLPYAAVAFTSVFIYIYKYGSATFNTTLNRMTSLLAGTAATLAAHWMFQLKAPAKAEWVGLIFVLIAIGFLAWGGWEDEKAKEAKKAKAQTEADTRQAEALADARLRKLKGE